jgi:ribonuclease R
MAPRALWRSKIGGASSRALVLACDDAECYVRAVSSDKESGSRARRGVVSVNPRGFGFMAFDETDSAFVAPPDLNGFLTGDVVRARLVESGERQRVADLLLVERPRKQLFGSVGTRKGQPHLEIDPAVSNTDWPLDGADDLETGAFVVASIEGDRAVVKREIAPADQSLERVVLRHGLRTSYPDVPLRKLSKNERIRRRDLRDTITVTIDAPSSRDLDDALSVLPADDDGAVRVLVSIADVDALVPIDSPLDVEARARTTSVYLAGRVLPMLPSSLSEDALSLLPGIDRPSLTAELRIDPEGAVTAIDIYESVIRSDGRLSYEQVAAFLERGDEEAIPEAMRSTLRWLRTAVARLDTIRSARGGVSLLREEAMVEIDEDTREPTSFVARGSNSAHRLVERLMVAANEAVATWLNDRGLPALYRVHDEPTPDKVAQLTEAARMLGLEAGFGKDLPPRALAAFERQFRGRPNAPALYTVLGRLLGPARYDPRPSAHFGLGAPLYLHFTSPIRRYADLVVHRVIKAYLRGARSDHPHAASLESIAALINERTRGADKAEQERLRMLAARFFAQRIGDELRGNVVSIKPFGLIVQLEDTGVTATVATEQLPDGPYKLSADAFAFESKHRRFIIGQPLNVVVRGADEVLGRIELDLAP